ncbi:YdcF family protein [Crocinitomicaceae bacterium CZZ-1]|uniref:YdcF family protein n=1 Tax=Taishania pollutisoli TaxID=2766479 RepID=A0A8J6TYD0_9FLAO|nr:ElyC/SanA/YdcF family protein [Taishania pollutisoli]MBC9813931.1 YdcF family protein [Taishania pollutisoli]MBX2949460.1 YdcF family protein [Crocinitomicaceae bacterium]
MKKRLFKYGVILLLLIIGFTVFCNWKIAGDTKAYVFDRISDVPQQKVGVLLGTSKLLKNGNSNQYFTNRIEAAVQLFEQDKIQYIIVSGDNSSKEYNEPEDMKIALVERGIPENRIILDYAGFRTFDSVIRAKEIFGQTKYVIISQKFHNQRAVYIARKNGIEAYGFNAEDVKNYGGFKTKVREIFARNKVFIDQLIGQKPKFLGEKIEIR